MSGGGKVGYSMGNIVRHSTFEELLKAGRDISGNGPAVYYEENGEKKALSFQDLLEKVEEVEVPDATSIGILCDGGLPTILNIFAAAKAEKQIVMLEPSLPVSSLKMLIQVTDCDGLMGKDSNDPELLSALGAGVKNPSHNMLYFTSGTTSMNKAVVLTESSFCASAYNGSSCDPLAPGDTLLGLLPYSHVYGFVCCLLWAWECGAAVALGRGRRHFLDDCAFYRPTALTLVPALVGFFYQNKLFNPELKQILIGAGGCPPQLMAAIKAMGIDVSFGYGLTETSSGVAISTGNPDPTQLTVCPDFEVKLAEDGEILIRSDYCMMQGYYKNPEATAAAIQDGYLHTGDLGKFDEQGKLHIIGRKKEILVLPSGTKIFLPEYEMQLTQALGEQDLCVMLDPKDRVIAIVSAEGKKPEDYQEALNRFNATKDRSEQITRLEVRAEPLPRTATGKLKRWMIISN